MDEVFGDDNFVALIPFLTTTSQSASGIGSVADYLVWYSKSRAALKYRQLYSPKEPAATGGWSLNYARFDGIEYRPLTREEREQRHSLPQNVELYRLDNLTSQGPTPSGTVDFEFNSKKYHPGSRNHWKTTVPGMQNLARARRIQASTNSIQYVRFFNDFAIQPITNIWTDSTQAGFVDNKLYVVQTVSKVVERCILMTTDPGDLVLDPTCGSGTTAYVAEQWGRRWVTIDTSRVALALARARIMGARYLYYTLADSREGQLQEAEVSRRDPSQMPTYGNVRQGFVYERVPHITLRDIANNAEIDVIYEEFRQEMEPICAELNRILGTEWEEWEIPREPGDPWPEDASVAWLVALGPGNTDADKATALQVLNSVLGRNYTLDSLPEQPRDQWEPEANELHQRWWELRIARQKEIDASIAAHAEYEYLYDKPYEDRSKVRVAGPFTVESISPHRVLGVDENGDVIDGIAEPRNGYSTGYDFGETILDNLRRSGVQQAHKEDRISFTSLMPWPGRLVCAEGKYVEGASGDDDDAMSGPEKRAGIFIGPEFGTVSRPDLVEAAREAAECGFDVLIACAFNYDAHTTEFESLGRVPVLKARMNADLHMAGELKNTGNGNLFVIFGEPDIDILDAEDNHIQVRVNGVDVFHPNTGEVRSDGPDGIACWFIDTDYDQESFFVRHAYFLGASDPYRSLKTTLKAEIDADAWATLNSDTSRTFPKPETGRIAVKVINHLGDEVMKVFRVG